MNWGRFAGRLGMGLLLLAPAAGRAELVDVESLVEPLRAVGPKGAGHQQATAAWRQLSRADAEQLPAILAGMDGANELAHNWIRAAVDAVVQRTRQSRQPLPLKQLEQFLADHSHSPKARRTAYELIKREDPSAEQRLIPGMLDDPSLELRRDSVRLALARAEKLLKDGDNEAALAAFRKAATAARDLDQVQAAAKKLKELGESYDVTSHYGFLLSWKLVGPFDNRDTSGFDVPYGPESDPSLDSYAGKEGEVRWREHQTTDPMGMVNLNEALGRHKGAIAYAYTEFYADGPRDCELRIGCTNGNKVWLNGQLVTSNHVYHAGASVDQYKGQARLKKGRNEILVKIAQNEQTEQWAQDWQFQLRVCDHLGTAIPSQEP